MWCVGCCLELLAAVRARLERCRCRCLLLLLPLLPLVGQTAGRASPAFRSCLLMAWRAARRTNSSSRAYSSAC